MPFMMMTVILRRNFAQFGGSWRAFWDHFALMLGHMGVLEAKMSQSGRFSGFQPPHFEGFWRPPGRVFGDIFVFFLDIDFAIGFHLLLR